MCRPYLFVIVKKSAKEFKRVKTVRAWFQHQNAPESTIIKHEYDMDTECFILSIKLDKPMIGYKRTETEYDDGVIELAFDIIVGF